jgi:hypothetical protein
MSELRSGRRKLHGVMPNGWTMRAGTLEIRFDCSASPGAS